MSVTFREALVSEYRKWMTAKEVPSSFAFYCGLSDRIGSDFTARKKAVALFRIDEQIRLIGDFLSRDAAKVIPDAKKRYRDVASVLPRKAYEDLIDLLAFCGDPQKYPLTRPDEVHRAASVQRKKAARPAPEEAPEPQTPPVRVRVAGSAEPSVSKVQKPPARKQGAKPAKKPAPKTQTPARKRTAKSPQKASPKPVVKKATPAPIPPVPAPPTKPVRKRKTAKRNCEWLLWLFAAVGISVGVVLLSMAGWTFWQWVVGIAGGAFAVFALYGISVLIDEVWLIDTVFSLLIIFPVLSIANLILLIIFKTDYKIVFSCVSVIQTVAYAVAAVFSFDDLEEGCGWGHITEGVINLLITVVSLIV